MKTIIRDFCRRGLIACGSGPLVLAGLYLILRRYAGLEQLSVDAVCTGIFSLSALAFISGGMNVIYQIERLPLMTAVLIHGAVLYLSYLATYLLNSWLEWGMTPILVFTVIFIFSYLAIWAVIYFSTRKKTEQVNALLKQKQQSIEN